MKIEKSERIKIGNEDALEQAYIQKANEKIVLMSTVKSFCEQYVTIEDNKAFYEDIQGHFTELLRLKYGKDVPKWMSAHKLHQMLEINMKVIIDKQKEIEANDVVVDPSTLEAESKCFSIWAEGSLECTRWKKATKLIKAIEDIKGEGRTFYDGAICQNMGGTLSYDWHSNSIQPSLAYVKGY